MDTGSRLSKEDWLGHRVRQMRDKGYEYGMDKDAWAGWVGVAARPPTRRREEAQLSRLL